MNDEKVVQHIVEGIDYLDSKIQVDIPNMNHFRQLTAAAQKKREEAKNRQFFVFVLSAIGILGVEMLSFYIYFHTFLVQQILALVVFPIGLLFLSKHRHRRVDKA